MYAALPHPQQSGRSVRPSADLNHAGHGSPAAPEGEAWVVLLRGARSFAPGRYSLRYERDRLEVRHVAAQPGGKSMKRTFLSSLVRDLEAPIAARGFGTGWFSGFFALVFAVAGLCFVVALRWPEYFAMPQLATVRGAASKQ
eukprot:gene1060-1439_t